MIEEERALSCARKAILLEEQVDGASPLDDLGSCAMVQLARIADS